jgi:hypothetical protein
VINLRKLKNPALGSLVCPWLVFRAIKTGVIDFIPFAPVFFTCVMEVRSDKKHKAYENPLVTCYYLCNRD